MRARLTLILYVPSLLLLLVLGGGFVTSLAQADQQRVYVAKLRDASYLTIAARESLRAEDSELIDDDLARYQEVYGSQAAVITSAGEVWASNGADLDRVLEQVGARGGRRSELESTILPWHIDDVVIVEPVYEGGDQVASVVTITDVHHVAGEIWRNWALLLGVALLLVGLAHVAARRTADWVLTPVRRVNRAMSRIGSGQLGARIPESVGPPELRDVTARFNEMAGRVQHLVHKQREFVHNASHELRNPLTALSLRVEGLALSGPADQAEEVNAVRAETVRLRQILDALLLLADDAPLEDDVACLDLVGLLDERAETWRLLAPDRTVAWAPPAAPVRAVANPAAVECALDTVIDNALKFSPDDQPVVLSLDRDGESVDIVVRDHGPGIDPDQIDLATDRFWRGPQHRGVRGSGLGLSIASELLTGLGGGVHLELPADGGLRVRLRLPVEADR